MSGLTRKCSRQAEAHQPPLGRYLRRWRKGTTVCAGASTIACSWFAIR